MRSVPSFVLGGIGCLLTAFGSFAAEPDFEASARKAVDEVLASPSCDEDTSIQDCYNAIITKLNERVDGEKSRGVSAAEAAQENVQDKATSAETGTSGASPLRDALSRLIAAAGIPGLTDEDGELVFAYNAPSGLFDDEVQLSFKATAKEGDVYQPLVEAFDQEVRAEKKSAFEDRLGEFDDVVVELSLSRLSKRWGRDFDFHQLLFQSLWVEAGAARTIAKADQTGFLKFINDLHCPGVSEEELFTAAFSRLEAGCGGLSIPALKSALGTNALATAGGFASLVSIAKTNGVMEVADLVSNQPQLFFSAKYRDRDDELTGPDELMAQLKWEKGFRNVNGLRKFCEKRGEMKEPEGGGRSQPTLDCVYTYLYCSRKDPTDCSPDRNRARDARRLSFSAEYSDVDAYAFSPETGIDVMRDGSESVKAMFAYGWQLRTEDDGTAGMRIDFESIYEDVSNDPMKNDRWVSTLTYSQQVSGETAASLSLVWANKPEFLGEVDEELSARLGLKWTMDPTR